MYALIDDKGVVIQTQPNKQDGFIEVDDDVVCGMIRTLNGFIIPEKTEEELKEIQKQNILNQILDLEQQQSRPLRELMIDSTNQFAKSKIESIDTQIAELRKQL